VDPTPEFSFYSIRELSGHLEVDGVVLTPNFRLARAIKDSWGHSRAALGQRCWPVPMVMSLQQWWQDCYQRAQLAGLELPVLATPLQELELWQQVIERHPQGELLLRPRGAAQQAREAWHNLLLWELDWRESGVAQEFRFDPDAAVFLQWAEQFEAGLQERELAALPQLLPDIADACPSAAIVLAEFDAIPPLHLSALGRQSADLRHVDVETPGASCYFTACESDEAEILAAAAWAVAEHQRNPQSRIALVHPELQQRRFTVEQALRRAFDLSARQDAGVASASRSMPVNFSAGVALSSCGPIRTALALLELPVTDPGLPELVKLLHSRYRDRSELEREQALIERLYRYGRDRVSGSRLRYECGRPAGEGEEGLALGQVLLELEHSRRLRGQLSCSDWRDEFSRVLEALGWPGPGPLDSLEYQQLEHWYQVLEELSQFDSLIPSLGYQEALQRLRQCSDTTVFQPQTENAPIQVLGLLEGAGLQFDAVWLCKMGAASWPAPPAPNPFIPGHLQKQLGMPHASAERELDYARSLLDRYRRSSALLVASYAQVQDDAEQQASELIGSFEVLPAATQPETLPWEWLEIQKSTGREWFVDAVAAPLAQEQRAAVAGGSALIADQSQCPFRAFAYHRLGARPLPELGIGLNAMERGSLLHDALYQLWGSLTDRATLAALTAEQRRQKVSEAVVSALDSFRLNDSRALGQALAAVEERRLRGLLEQWLELELEREDFSVIALEQDHELELGPLLLKVRLDRVDRLADGGELIIDYKSGKSAVGDWLGRRPRSPQLPMYAQLAGSELSGLGFAVINQRDLGFQGIADIDAGPGFRTDIANLTKNKDPELEDWPSLKAHWQELLLALAEDFAEGRAEVDPADPNNTCNYCGLESLCRVK